MKKIGLTAILLLTVIGAKAQSCSPADGSSSTISSNCTGLNWNSGDVSINTGVTINAIGSSNAVTIGSGVVGTLTNSGTLAGGSYSGIDTELNAPTITSIINTATGNITGGWGIYTYSGSVGSITNAGLFNVATFGILNLVTINEINNTGVISSGYTGIRNLGTIDTLTNSDKLSGGTDGIQNYGEIQSLVNTDAGTISGVSGRGIYNSQNITSLNNSGVIEGGSKGVFSDGDATRLAVINNLNNSGLISGTNTGVELSRTRVDSLVNSGTIESNNLTDNAVGIRNSDGIIDTLLNSGSINASSSGDDIYVYGIINSGTISELSNAGVIAAISTGINGSTYGIYNGLGGTITTLNNSGTISAGDNGFGINNQGTITTLNNSNIILAGDGREAVRNFGNISTLNNTGTISAGNSGTGIGNIDMISLLNNSGTISAGDNGFGLFNASTIITLNNAGAIFAGDNGYGVINQGFITTLNNSQGGNGASAATTALIYGGILPTNYNIIINSATHYGQLAVNNPLGAINNFGIYGAPVITSRVYAGVLSGTDLPTGISSGSYDGMRWSLAENGVGTYDLTFAGASLIGTQQSLVNAATGIQNTFALQNSVLSNSFGYDCSVFGKNNVCVSAGGRNTAVSNANGLNNTSALLIGAYRVMPTLRIGAYADQNLSVNNEGSTISLGNSAPLIGLFGVWSERVDGAGAEVKVSAAYGRKSATINRQIVGLSEPGSGSSNLNSQGAQITAKYGFAVMPEVIVSPYIGVRHTQNNMGGYTEASSGSVTTPLSYSALKTTATTALLGVGTTYQFVPKATVFASAGIETDISVSNGTYSA